MSKKNNLRKFSFKKTLIILTIITFILLISLSLYLYLNSKKISQNNFLEGKNIKIQENDNLKFEINTKEYTLTIESVNEDSIDISTESEPIIINLKIGQEKNFDLDNDGNYDVLVRLNSINNEELNIYVKRIIKFTDTEEIIDCGEGEPINNCYMEAAKNCYPAKISSSVELNFLGFIVYSKSYREIQGLENEKCIEYVITEDYSFSYSEEMRNLLIQKGSTKEEIDQELTEKNKLIQKIIGTDSTCKYPIEKFITKLEEEQQGILSILSFSDATKYQCTGST
ncbi:MAG: hypothetical protein OQK82_04265, partial [Candidatus Pacearchaeota archaeon]|nr:hypothetical protein [Candidatus Pacearchaeota archaeon]